VTRTGLDVATGRIPMRGDHQRRRLSDRHQSRRATDSSDRTGTLAMLDLKTHKLAFSVAAGRVTEHVALSRDGKYALVVLANGAATQNPIRAMTACWHPESLCRGPGTLTEVAHADTGHWCQARLER